MIAGDAANIFYLYDLLDFIGYGIVYQLRIDYFDAPYTEDTNGLFHRGIFFFYVTQSPDIYFIDFRSWNAFDF